MTTIYYDNSSLLSLVSAWVFHLRCGNDIKYLEYPSDENFTLSEEIYFLHIQPSKEDLQKILQDQVVNKVTLFIDSKYKYNDNLSNKLRIKPFKSSEIFEDLQLNFVTTYQFNIQKLLKYIDNNSEKLIYKFESIGKTFDLFYQIVDNDLSNEYIFRLATSHFHSDDRLKIEERLNRSYQDNLNKFIALTMFIITMWYYLC